MSEPQVELTDVTQALLVLWVNPDGHCHLNCRVHTSDGGVDHAWVIAVLEQLIESERKHLQPSITCPVCHKTSYHPTDVETGYCGNCCGYTSPVNPLAVARRVVEEAKKQPKGEQDA